MHDRRVLDDLLVETFNTILKVEEQALKVDGLQELSINEVHILEAIYGTDGIPMSELAERHRVTVASMTTAIDKLVRKGFARRDSDPSDRRVVLIRLEKPGHMAVIAHRRFHNELINEAVDGLDQEEERVLISALRSVRDFFIRKAKNEEAE